MRKFEVTEIVQCDECKGAGALQDPFWEAFHLSNRTDPWGFANDYGCDPQNLPPEEFDCLAGKQSAVVLDLIQYLRFIIPTHYGIVIESLDDIITIDLK